MPRYDTSFNFGANAPSKPKSKPARPKAAAKRPKAGKSKSRKFYATMHGS
jgi:hypothetical protein